MTEIKVKIDGLQELTEVMKEVSQKLSIQPEKVTETPQKVTETAKNQQKEPEKAPEPTKGISLEEMQVELAGIAKSGKQNEVKDLIKSYGVTMLSAVPEEKREELLEKARVL